MPKAVTVLTGANRRAPKARAVLGPLTRSLFLLLLPLLLSPPLRAEEPGPALARLAQEAVAEDGVVGIVIAAAVAGEAPIVVAAGLADRARRAPMTPGTGFKAASIAKTFLAALALALAEDGKLALDDKLVRFRPEVPNAGRVSLRQLMNHSAGYDDYLSDAFVRAAHAQPGKIWTARELLAFARPERLGFIPGSRFAYSNTDYLLLRMALEAVLGHSAADEIRRRFLGPLGLAWSWFASEEAVPADALAHGYAERGRNGGLADVTSEPAELGGADGALVSNAADLLRWAEALYGGRVLSARRLGDMLAFTDTRDAADASGGYGLGVERFRFYGVAFHGHTGSAPGYNSAMLYEPATRTALVVALNVDPPDEALLGILAERIVRALERAGKLRLGVAPDAEPGPPGPVPSGVQAPAKE